jgi:dienelactone hydrolase
MKPLLFLLLVTSVIAADEIRTEHDVDYLGDDRKEKADLYLPCESAAGAEVSRAVVIIHGGGWSGGQKRAAREINIGTTLALNGYVGMSIDYVLANSEHPGPTWPQNLHDCKTAVRWLRANAERLQIDSAHIGVIGGSAGGHLATMVGLCGGELDPPGEGDCRVQCAVDLYGPCCVLSSETSPCSANACRGSRTLQAGRSTFSHRQERSAPAHPAWHRRQNRSRGRFRGARRRDEAAGATASARNHPGCAAHLSPPAEAARSAPAGARLFRQISQSQAMNAVATAAVALWAECKLAHQS